MKPFANGLIVLGAACGEAVLCKKIGNKALLFGAIGGTIPDLDVFIGSWLYNNEIQAMAFHRGFMHSILFSIFGAFVFGWLFFKLYDKGKRFGSTKIKDWQILFFWSLFTHIILDSFTPYGTQLFYPFLDYRVAFNNISVVDPLYTVPFLICLIVLMFFKRQKKQRLFWLKLGLGISSFYMVLTFMNKFRINSIFKESLQTQNIAFNRLKEINDWQIIEKEPSVLDMSGQDLATLVWFSDGYYKIRMSDVEGEYLYSDLRYALLNPEDAKSSLFKFRIFKKEGRWDMKSSGPDFDKNATTESIFGPMIKRLKGN